MNREKIVNQVKTLLRSTNFTNEDLAEAPKAQIAREDFAKSEEARKPLFDRAVAAIRRGESTTQVAADLDSACAQIGIDSFDIARRKPPSRPRGDIMPATKTSTAERLAEISTFETRSVGGLHSQHVQGHHDTKPNKACDLCLKNAVSVVSK